MSDNPEKSTSKGRKIVFIGNGIAGVTCARHIRKRDSAAQITLISGETEHFFSRTALMYLYMGHMKYKNIKPYEDFFWGKNRLQLVYDWVTEIDFEGKTLKLQQHDLITYDILILATGSVANKFGWPGQALQGVQGLYSYQDLEAMEANTNSCQRAVVVGGGLIGIEMAEMLRSRDIPVTFLVREENFWGNVLPKEEAQLVNRHVLEHHIELKLVHELKEIQDDGTGKVGGVVTSTGEQIDCQFVGLAVGVSPNIALFKDTPLETNRGVLVDEYFATSIPDVYAIGDCAEFRKPVLHRRSVEQTWYTGRMHGETLAYSLTRKPVPYHPGAWFNSAKFLDIEYQTYGVVPARWGDELQSLYWEHPEGKICFRAMFEAETKVLTGVNAFGLRLRHDFFDKALRNGSTIEEVLARLDKADFNGEFFDKGYLQDIVRTYNEQFDASLRVHKKKGLFSFLRS
ncbi:NAD(P)/FAD-dependent oxidoreductase [Pontibacter pamirensis]|uniref:NAD(P)/FAD-dependent oxidoreductase n=1 Tax=Pontibacter pamirensis TaxID=2562824 RepID=UPI0013897902|nr:FAD/NAD(P)-binding oxidoreductase [Pontibacter pamirensis]